MKAKHIKHLLLIPIVAVAVAGCSSAPSRFYTLNSTATGDGAPAANYGVLVGPVSIPALVDRPQFTVQVATNRVALDEFNRWAAPLSDNIARVVTQDLVVLLGTPHVATAPLANFESAYRVTIDIQRFESVRNAAKQNEGVLVEAVWVVRRSAGGAARSGQTVARESAQGSDFDALVAAHSRALAKVSRDIAAAIRADANEKP
jgi:uncharacterized lipoprotein YmbA